MSRRPGGLRDAIDLYDLRCFLAIVDEVHLGSAAARLQSSEPELAARLRALEDEVGVRLAVHAEGAVLLTDAGRAFAHQAQRAVAAADVAVADARRAGGVGAAVRIGCAPGLPVQLLQAFIGALRHAADTPLEVEIAHLRGPEQRRRLRTGEIHLALAYDAGDHDGLLARRLFPGERLAAFLPQGHRLAVHSTIGPDELRDETLVVPARRGDPALHDRMLELIDEAGYRFAAVRQAGGELPRDVLFAAAGGLGVALGAISLRQVVGDVATIVTRCTLDPPAWMPDTMLAWSAEAPRGLGAVLDAAAEAAKTLEG